MQVLEHDAHDGTTRLRYADGEMWQDLTLFTHRKMLVRSDGAWLVLVRAAGQSVS